MIEDPFPQEPTQIPIEETLQSTPKSNWKIWLAAGGCAVFLCAAVFVGTLVIAGPKFVQKFIPEKIQVADNLPPLTAQSNAMGNPNAPVHIIEYGDFQCPYCLKF